MGQHMPGAAGNGPMTEEGILERRSSGCHIDLVTQTDNDLQSPVLSLLSAQTGLRGTIDDVTRVLGLPVDVLIRGESGTGKELIARLLHETDPLRHAHRFVAVNCAALPDNLLEADLFGYRRGAFTGATHDREGLFQQAHGGTLFLDEIGDLPLHLQPKLLRALQERAIRPVGGCDEVSVDVRVVSATNLDLHVAMSSDLFRRDLYYRLADFVVDLPPLRERRSDIPLLADHFLKLYCRQFNRPHIEALGEGSRTWLCRCDWRANNVRELSVVMKRAVLLCDGDVLTPQHLWQAVSRGEASRCEVPDVPDERAQLEAVLERMGGNLSAAARHLGMKRSTLHDRLRRHGIRRVAHS
jgi:transcriptional regulator with GAF, ATPase, and Fis domain